MAWRGEIARLWKRLLYLPNYSVRLALFSTKVTMTFLVYFSGSFRVV